MLFRFAFLVAAPLCSSRCSSVVFSLLRRRLLAAAGSSTVLLHIGAQGLNEKDIVNACGEEGNLSANENEIEGEDGTEGSDNQSESDEDSDNDSLVDMTEDEDDESDGSVPNELERNELEIEEEKTRWPTMMHKVHIRPFEKREPIILNEFGQPIGPVTTDKDTVGEFSRFLGTIARDYGYAPLILKSWHKVPKKNKDRMWEYVLVAYVTALAQFFEHLLCYYLKFLYLNAIYLLRNLRTGMS